MSSQIQGTPGKSGVRENTGFNLMFRELSSTVSPWGNDFLGRQRERTEPDRQKFVQRWGSNKPWEQVAPGESTVLAGIKPPTRIAEWGRGRKLCCS